MVPPIPTMSTTVHPLKGSVLSCAIATVTTRQNAMTANAMIGSRARSANLRTASMVLTLRSRTPRAVGPTTYPSRTTSVVGGASGRGEEHGAAGGEATVAHDD